MPVYTVDGQDIHVHEEGPEDGAPVILIHGWSSSWYAVSPLFRILNRRYRCFAVDLPGFGASPPLPQQTTIGKYVKLIHGLIQQITDKQVTLIGHSMGGMISVDLALEYPDLIERLILLCPTISGHLALQINLTLGPFVLLERFPLTNSLVTLFEPLVGITDRLLRPALFADQSGITLKDYEKIRADARQHKQGRVRAECFWAMRNNDLRGKLCDIEIPALVIWGMEDNTVPLRDASVIAREWPEADLRVIPNAGHWPQFETPEITLKYIKAFLSMPIKLLKTDFF
jgi:pimeloyl-ACP methyl ester carboxylesterase